MSLKKLIAVFICLVMIAGIAIATVSADAKILFYDPFDTKKENDWLWDSSNFYVKDGVLMGDPTAVIHQSAYDPKYGQIRRWDTFTNKVDIKIVDYDESNFIGSGLWWRDYNTSFEEENAGANEDGEIWTYRYNYVTNSVILESDYLTNKGMTAKTYQLPRNAVKIGPDDDPTTFSLGWRIQPGKIECYFNNQLVITCTDVPADLGTHRESPILLMNHSAYVEFDNFVVATVDYNLFNETDTPTPVDPGNNGGGQQPAGTKVVEKIETDENGETRIVTEIVADTNANNPSANNGGSNTGDMIVAVAAVMAVAAAGAIVVAKRREH